MIGLILTALGGLASAASQYQASQYQADLAEQTAETNRQLAEARSEQEAMERAAAEREERSQARRRRQSIEGAYAKSGVLLSGTPEEYLTEQVKADESTIQDRTRASGYRRQLMEWEGAIGVTQAKNRAKAMRSEGLGSLIGGIGSTVGTFAGSEEGSDWLKKYLKWGD